MDSGGDSYPAGRGAGPKVSGTISAGSAFGSSASESTLTAAAGAVDGGIAAFGGAGSWLEPAPLPRIVAAASASSGTRGGLLEDPEPVAGAPGGPLEELGPDKI